MNTEKRIKTKKFSEPCLVCNFKTRYHMLDNRGIIEGSTYYSVDCFRCGEYYIHSDAKSIIPSNFKTKRQLANLSAWIREQNSPIILYDDLKWLCRLTKPGVAERGYKLLKYISSIRPEIGDWINKVMISGVIEILDGQKELHDYAEGTESEFIELAPMLAVSWSTNWNELFHLLKNLLADEKGFIDQHFIDKRGKIKITPKGWTFLEEYDKKVISDQAFIAMKYDYELLKFFREWVKPAIIEAGYNPIIIGDESHSNIIDDQMKVEIQRSKFIISDLTFNSRGAYYEAGYAHGLGLPVIFTIEEKYNKSSKKANEIIHFDTDHYPIKKWNYGETGGKDFKKWLTNRILTDGKIGKGNYIEPESS